MAVTPRTADRWHEHLLTPRWTVFLDLGAGFDPSGMFVSGNTGTRGGEDNKPDLIFVFIPSCFV